MRTPLLFSLLLASTAPAADLYVSSITQHSVRRYDGVTGAYLGAFVTAGSGGLVAPHRTAFGPDGHFYVASAGTSQILRYDGVSGAFLNVFAVGPQLSDATDFQWGPGGSLYVSSQGQDSIVRFDGVTGAYQGTLVASAAGGLDGPSGIHFHNGKLFVAGRHDQRIHRYDGITGAHELAIGAGSIGNAFGIDIGPDGLLYATSNQTNSVLRFNPDTGAALGAFVTAGSGGQSAPVGLEFGPDGSLFVASAGNDSVKRYDAITGAFLGNFVFSGSGGLDAPVWLSHTAPVPEPGQMMLLALALNLFPLQNRLRRVRRSVE